MPYDANDDYGGSNMESGAHACKACGALVPTARREQHTVWHQWLEDVAAAT